MKRPKLKKEKKYTLTEKDIQKIKRETAEKAHGNATLWTLCAAKDALNLSDDDCVKILENATRYAEYIDKHIIEIQEMQKLAEKTTGLKFVHY